MTICVVRLSWGNLGHGHRSSSPRKQVSEDHDHMCSKPFGRRPRPSSFLSQKAHPQIGPPLRVKVPEASPSFGALGRLQCCLLVQNSGISTSGEQLLQLDLPALAGSLRPLTDSVWLDNGELASCTIMRDALLEVMATKLPKAQWLSRTCYPSGAFVALWGKFSGLVCLKTLVLLRIASSM